MDGAEITEVLDVFRGEHVSSIGSAKKRVKGNQRDARDGDAPAHWYPFSRRLRFGILGS